MEVKWLEFRVESTCKHDSDTYSDCPLCRINKLEATIERVRELREYWNTYAANNAKYGYDEYSKAVNTCGNDLNEALGDSEVGD